MSNNNDSPDATKCPFCGVTITEDVALYGGTCPRCFGEIPGEEAITDPGDLPTELGLKIYEARSKLWHVVPILIALFIAMGLGAWALWVGFVRPAQMAERIDFDEESDFDFMAEMVEYHLDTPEPEPEPVPAAGAVTPAPHPTKAAARPTTDVPAPKPGGAMHSALLAGSGSADIGASGSISKLNFNANAGGDEGSGSRKASTGGSSLPVDAGPDLEIKRTSGAGGGLGLSVQVKAEREKPIIKDRDEIKEHIYNVFKKSLPGLMDCYKDRLKEDGAVRGKWRISFVVTRSGHTRDPDAQGISMVDEKLEACLREKVLAWSFYRLPNDQPVSRSLNFTPR